MELSTTNVLLVACLLFTSGAAMIVKEDDDTVGVDPTKTTAKTTRSTRSTEETTTPDIDFTSTVTTTTTTTTTRDSPGECECDPCKIDEMVTINLKTPGLDITSAVSGSIPGLQMISYFDPTTKPKECDAQVVLSVDFLTYPPCDSKKYCYNCIKGTKCNRRMLEIVLGLGEKREGWLFTIGDSESNDGDGGDDDDQKNDAEIQCLHPDVTAFGSETCEQPTLAFIPEACNSDTVTIRISDGQIWYKSNKDFKLCDECLFALNNQPDLGPNGVPNERILVSLNRVIQQLSTPREGYGVCRARFKWVCPDCEH